jgi:hypothetical protein
MDVMHYQNRLAYWRAEYERLAAIPPERANADITALMFSAADMAVRLQNSITWAIQNARFY